MILAGFNHHASSSNFEDVLVTTSKFGYHVAEDEFIELNIYTYFSKCIL